MDNYVRKLKIQSLFTDGNNFSIEFDENVNCIYGSNGTGKTTVINILVSALCLDLKQLSKLPFKSAIIQTSQTGKRRAKPFLEVCKTTDGKIQISLLNGNDEEKKVFDYKSNRAEAEQPEVNERQSFVDKIKQHLTITYVPLSRMQESDAYDSNRPEEYWLSQVLKSRHLSSTEVAEIIDPNRRMLKGIEGLFKQRYTEAQNKINKGLDNLKDTIIRKLLLDKQYVTKISLRRQEISSKELPKSKFEEYSERLRSASLNVEVEALSEHFRIIDETVNEISEARKNYFIAVDKKIPKDIEKYRDQYWDADRKYRSLYPMHDRLLSIVKDIEDIDESKEILMSPFNYFKSVVNSFLINKSFSFSNVGGFEIFSGNRAIDLADLSSGEKHMIALLGRVSLSPTTGAVFIADEPELSLHLEWQRKILPSILQLSPKIQIIVATHSPAIIPSNANLIDLDECN